MKTYKKFKLLVESVEVKDLSTALKIFNITSILSKDKLKKKYHELANKNHPDHGGSLEKMKLINLAYDYLQSVDTKGAGASPLNKNGRVDLYKAFDKELNDKADRSVLANYLEKVFNISSIIWEEDKAISGSIDFYSNITQYYDMKNRNKVGKESILDISVNVPEHVLFKDSKKSNVKSGGYIVRVQVTNPNTNKFAIDSATMSKLEVFDMFKYPDRLFRKFKHLAGAMKNE